ncbi:molybdate ABC transporter substrate-binding protein [Terriglobus roseus]|uniref:Molybdate transport system substrate-binding protein n=1 Tax=Terriglobus roseus TaxID=392734 RepID=A0A1H4S8C0_9BACT|nr:molybdate ABC transporter substrate-binding protein [Terriglobus roseus]SEC40362.1 molybdate transport system substrate-binding protein [Terriglobus roseus]
MTLGYRTVKNTAARAGQQLATWPGVTRLAVETWITQTSNPARDAGHKIAPAGARSRRSFTAMLAAFLLTAAAPLAIHAQDNKVVTVSAAADMEPVLQVVGPIFEQKTGLKLKVSFASSATLAQQIQNGAPADIFFSADFYFAEQVVADGLTETKSPIPYAKGLLVLWTRKGSRFSPLSIDALSRKDLGPVAVANPDRAPYGRSAVIVLKRMKLWDNVAPHIVQAESVAQAGQFALSGNAELAMMSQTIAMSPAYRDKGTFVLFPFSQYPEIIQSAVILKKGANVEGAHKLLNFVLSDQVQQNLSKLGLQAVK